MALRTSSSSGKPCPSADMACVPGATSAAAAAHDTIHGLLYPRPSSMVYGSANEEAASHRLATQKETPLPSSSSSASAGQQRGGPRALPARRYGERIVEKVMSNRVTLIQGETGTGKSSQVPQLLLEAGLGPIYCTQPRRIAVVAVAQRVAEEMGCEVGEEVGYHIGQKNVSTSRCRLVFATAGVLLEELRANGLSELSRFRTIILDEVHERSVESDLVLSCIRQMLITKGTAALQRLVLMSATADFNRYAEYFKEASPGERLQRVAIPLPSSILQLAMFTTGVKYLEQVVSDLGHQPQHEALLSSLAAKTSSSKSRLRTSGMPLHDASEGESNAAAGLSSNGGAPSGMLSDVMHAMIRDLVLHLHAKDGDMRNSVLVFLPTYKALEQQWLLLQRVPSLRLYVLHSSIDTDVCIRAMAEAPSNQRKVILATNIAESSVTMPGVTFVVDSALSLLLKWDRCSQSHSPSLVWASQSQLHQRKGRTGRTCNGCVFRMLPRAAFAELPPFEPPAVQLLSLRKQTLQLACASSKALQDPHFMFSRCLDAPDHEAVSDALTFLSRVGAISPLPPTSSSPLLRSSPHSRKSLPCPSPYGRLLVSLPLSLEASMLLVKGGMEGKLREALLLAAVMDASPFPIAQPFGQPMQYTRNLQQFLASEDGIMKALPYPSIILANMLAFEFWQHDFLDGVRSHRIVHQARQIMGCHLDSSRATSESCDSICGLQGLDPGSKISREEELAREQQFCSAHHLLQSSLHAIHEKASICLETLHRQPPSFILNSPSRLHYSAPHPSSTIQSPSLSHNCHLITPSISSTTAADVSSLGMLLDSLAISSDASPSECATSPFVPPQCLLTDESRAWVEDLAKQTRNNPSNLDAFEESSPSTKKEVPGTHFEGHRRGSFQERGELHRDPSFGFSLDEPSSSDFGFSQVTHGFKPIVLQQYDKPSDLTMWSSHVGPSMCSFFARGSCLRGISCRFSHSAAAPSASAPPRGDSSQRGLVHLPQAKPACKFFAAPEGCRFGNSCRFRHSLLPAPAMPSKNSSTFSQSKASSTMAKPMSDLTFLSDASAKDFHPEILKALSSPHERLSQFTLLVGEGAFSFSLSLAHLLDDSQSLVATSADAEIDAFLKYPQIDGTISQLAALGHEVLFNVDLITSKSITDIIGKAPSTFVLETQLRTKWEDVGRIVWNFPFCGLDEDADIHRQLLRQFFLAISVPLVFWKLTSCDVILTFCNDQFARWQVERAAREHFLFLKQVLPFDLELFSGYVPVRNDSMLPFKVERAMMYIFNLEAPSYFSLGANKDQLF